MKRTIFTVVAALVAVLVLFDVDLAPRLVWSHSEDRPDPEQERQFAGCVEAADARIHEETFANIDNPDVQREILYRRGQAARADCRTQFPQRMVSVDVPFEFNLVDLEWRFGATSEDEDE